MTFTITDTAVFNGRELLAGRYDVRVDGDTVAALVQAGTGDPVGEVVDGAGATLLPGLIDGHVHFRQAVDFEALLAGGVTSAADMASWPPEHVAELRSHSGGIVFTTPGAPLIGPAGPHSHMPGLSDSVIDSPEAARREVAARAAQGVDYIKLVLEAKGRGGPESDAAHAAVDAAHAAGLRVVAHASSVGAIELGVAIGVDILTHAPLDGAVSAGTIKRIVEQGIVVVPTLIMMRTVAEARDIAPAYANAIAFVAAIHHAGVVIVAGSDANSAPGAPAAVFHGTGARDEVGLLVNAGLSPVEALRAATETSAGLFEFMNRGVVRLGSVADLLLVNGAPTTDITAVGDIRGVWLAGRRVS
ncbi:hypothetical protein B7R22_13615 [Subtercola boreus]|uniref:Amidohydrolase-related domain-containing protein n=1 Tax=Subtercola boreus TaxID=120213 RepID=A0A3E0VT61_9MICO|nr:amidohydrolase family protein [Subtercola boreus]RFA13204.1 hypothetical protein B7R22_13615 [Subtercola boreus]